METQIHAGENSSGQLDMEEGPSFQLPGQLVPATVLGGGVYFEDLPLSFLPLPPPPLTSPSGMLQAFRNEPPYCHWENMEGYSPFLP